MKKIESSSRINRRINDSWLVLKNVKYFCYQKRYLNSSEIEYINKMYKFHLIIYLYFLNNVFCFLTCRHILLFLLNYKL